MFKKMKLGLKIGMGFGLLLVIAVALGFLAIVNMGRVETQSTMLQKEYVPEVEMANQVERSSFRTMYAMRGYGFTGEQSFLDNAKKNMSDLLERLDKTKTLGNKAPHLKALTHAVEKAEQHVSTYEGLIQDTIALNKAMEANRQQLNAAAAMYMENANSYLAFMHETFTRDLLAGREKNRLEERVEKIRQANVVIDLGNDARILAWKAQAQRSPEVLRSAYANFPKIEDVLSSLLAVTKRQEVKDQLATIRKAGQNYKRALETFLDNWLKNEAIATKRTEVGDTVLAGAREVSIVGMNGTVEIADAAVSSLNSSSNIMIGGLIAAVIIGITVAFLITRSITKPIARGVNLAQEIAKGDFSMRLNMDSSDEIGVLAKALDGMADNLAQNAAVAEQIADGNLNIEVKLASDKDQLGNALQKMVESLNDIVGQLQVSGEQISCGSNEVSDSAQSLSQGATESASSLEEISASLNELSSQTLTNAENAGQANQLSAEAQDAAKKGGEKMELMVTAMAEINEAGQNISKIIKTIDEIAFQTNLLALNAAVEAARAGQHGKGFAVVAEEVRNLAARSAKAAEETSQLIEGSVEKTANGSTIAGQTAEALQGIHTSISKTSDLVSEIAAASNQQAQGVSQINQGVSQIDQVTQQNTAAAEESAAAAEELSGQAESMKHMLSRFILKNQKHTASVSQPQPIIAPKAANTDDWGGVSASPQITLDDKDFGKF